MNDKTLLELAAKAAGIEYGWQHIYDDYEGSTSQKWDWDPLTDDGDRYRLAKKLKFVIDFELETCGVDIDGEWVIFQWGGVLDESHAFVLAAAEIGKTLG